METPVDIGVQDIPCFSKGAVEDRILGLEMKIEQILKALISMPTDILTELRDSNSRNDCNTTAAMEKALRTALENTLPRICKSEDAIAKISSHMVTLTDNMSNLMINSTELATETLVKHEAPLTPLDTVQTRFDAADLLDGSLVGVSVKLQNLVSKSHLNGTEGRIIGRQKDRLQVLVASEVAPMLLKPGSLALLGRSAAWSVTCTQCEGDLCDANNDYGGCLKCPFHPADPGKVRFQDGKFPPVVGMCKDIGGHCLNSDNARASSSSTGPTSSYRTE